MPEERTSPSDGWRAVYREMNVSASAEATACPDCGDDSTLVRADTYWCPTHGTFAARG